MSDKVDHSRSEAVAKLHLDGLLLGTTTVEILSLLAYRLEEELDRELRASRRLTSQIEELKKRLATIEKPWTCREMLHSVEICPAGAGAEIRFGEAGGMQTHWFRTENLKITHSWEEEL